MDERIRIIFRNFVLRRAQQMVIGILLVLAILPCSILILRRIKEEKAFSNIKIIHLQSTEHRAQNTEDRAQNTEYRAQNTEYRIQTHHPSPITQNPKKININKAGLNELISLPGIGEKIAKEIINYRKENGTFSSIEDIMKVKGIGQKKFEKCKERIKVD